MSNSSYLTPDEANALKETFRAQTGELLEAFAREVLALEHTGDRAGSLKAIGRIVHTIKGDAMALEFTRLAELAHRLEDYLAPLRRGENALEREQIDALLACGDGLASLLKAYCAGKTVELPPIAPLLERLEVVSGGKHVEMALRFARDCKMRSAGAFLVRQRLDPLAEILETRPDPEDPAFESAPTWTLVLTPRVPLDELKKAARVPGIVSRVDVKPLEKKAAAPAPQPEREKSPEATGAEHLRVESEKVDRIMDLVGELVIGRSMVTQAISDLAKVDEHLVGRLETANGILERMMGELQAAVLKIRMVPVDRVFRRFPRMVRELAQACGKEVELEVEGGTTELDKGIVDALSEPLLHFVRNAVDHGLESRDERRRAGKPEVGRLKIAASYESQHVHIVVEDDGRGIDPERVARRAVELGLMAADDAESLPPADLLQAIYAPGFSTCTTVSTVSGRGIGLDIVREAIQKLKGTIEIDTAPGRGTRFFIRLPLTLAILRAILVEAGGRVFAIPLTEVLEILRLSREEEASVLGRGVLPHRDRVVPLVLLSEAFRFAEAELGGGSSSWGARARREAFGRRIGKEPGDRGRFGFGERQSRSHREPARPSRGMAPLAARGVGKLSAGAHREPIKRRPSMSGAAPIRVLIVDDSALMRKLLTGILRATPDLEVVGTAVDGDFALAKIEALRPDVVTLDLEMPRMDGLTTLRNLVERHRVPVVLVSSYTAEGAAVTVEALAAGAVDFVTKPERVLSSSLDALGYELAQKIRAAAGARVPEPEARATKRVARARKRPALRNGDFVVAIGVSTGGPNALSQLLPKIRPDFPGAFLIVQHMQAGFTAMFEERLRARCALEVREAAEGDPVRRGGALIAPGGRHLLVRRVGGSPVAALSDAPPVHGHRPSADCLFFSVAREYGRRAVGLVMTGMGADGAAGLEAMRHSGGHTLAQDLESSVICGMPKAAIDSGAVQKVLPLSALADYLNALELKHLDAREEQKHASM